MNPTIMQALRVTGISLPAILGVMAAFWALIIILRSAFPVRPEEDE
jgi:hypothetical protein